MSNRVFGPTGQVGCVGANPTCDGPRGPNDDFHRGLVGLVGAKSTCDGPHGPPIKVYRPGDPHVYIVRHDGVVVDNYLKKIEK